MPAPTHDAFEIDVLALNSGSSSLKFGLYRVGPAQTDLLLGGEAESIGEGAGKFHARDARDNVLLAETAPSPTRTRLPVSENSLTTAAPRFPPRSVTGLCMAAPDCGSIA
jgi:hypothetical protein